MKFPCRRQFLHLAAGAAMLPVVSRTARAQAYPTRPARIVLAAPFAGYIVRHLQPRPLMTAVGVLVSALALFQLAKSFG